MFTLESFTSSIAACLNSQKEINRYEVATLTLAMFFNKEKDVKQAYKTACESTFGGDVYAYARKRINTAKSLLTDHRDSMRDIIGNGELDDSQKIKGIADYMENQKITLWTGKEKTDSESKKEQKQNDKAEKSDNRLIAEFLALATRLDEKNLLTQALSELLNNYEIDINGESITNVAI